MFANVIYKSAGILSESRCFHCKDSFEDALWENDVIRSRDERATVRQLLVETKHAKPLLKTDQPVAYMVLCAIRS